MILGIDTDILVNWVMAGAPYHEGSRELLEREARTNGNQLGVTLQTLLEFQHICTDPRRFEEPLSMGQALDWSQSIWDGTEVARILPRPSVLPRAVELMKRYSLGRKRILDTALAATLECSGVGRLATLNRKDFEIFPFLELVSPG
ncbi:MAG: type II toxin-antitoxin system VapC family toxin [Vicinamibacteria bacterium]